MGKAAQIRLMELELKMAKDTIENLKALVELLNETLNERNQEILELRTKLAKADIEKLRDINTDI